MVPSGSSQNNDLEHFLLVVCWYLTRCCQLFEYFFNFCESALLKTGPVAALASSELQTRNPEVRPQNGRTLLVLGQSGMASERDELVQDSSTQA